MLAPVFNAMTNQWMLGRIDNHVAASLTKEEIEAHLKEHDELLRDKSRLDAVQAHSWQVAANRCGQWSVLVSSPDGTELLAKANSIRQAIDAAMSAEGGPK